MKKFKLSAAMLFVSASLILSTAGCGAQNTAQETVPASATESTEQDDAPAIESIEQDTASAIEDTTSRSLPAGAESDIVPADETLEAQPTAAEPLSVTEQSAAAAPLSTAGSTGERRDYRTQIKGGGEDVATLMIYLCGSDLESRGGAATIDLFEMISANISENLNIIIETGGANAWATDVMDPTLNQRWMAVNEDIVLLEEMEAKNMSEGQTLQDFITYSAETFPADRYMLVLWDHGGGTVSGYAYDERFEDNTLMSLDELDGALAGAGVNFDMIGFDCCLMGTAETAFMAEKYSDYMVASQRVEPGEGWYYTDWINALSSNTSIPTEELGKIIVDSFIAASSEGFYANELTLSMLDLTYIPGLFDSMYGFFTEADETMIDNGSFVTTTYLLGSSRAMQEDVDLVDMSVLLENMEGSEEILTKLEECVVYNGATIEDYNGLCLYFPYTDLFQVEEALRIYGEIGIGQNYQDFIGSFANLILGGQLHNSDGTIGVNPHGGDGIDVEYLASRSWVDESAWDAMGGFFDESAFAGGYLETVEKEVLVDGFSWGEQWVVPITEEQWQLITDVEQMYYIDDGEGYIELGVDDAYFTSDDGSLWVTEDYSWVALDGELVSFYTEAYETINEEEGSYYSYGYVPVLYEDEFAELVLWWDSEEYPDGTVMGWRYSDPGMGSQKGLFPLEDGMTFDIVVDYYTYDGEYDDWYTWGSLTVDGPMEVSYRSTRHYNTEVSYIVYDLFNNTYWTEATYWNWDEFLPDPEMGMTDWMANVNSGASGISEDGYEFYYASTDTNSTLIIYDPRYREYLDYTGTETIEGSTVTIHSTSDDPYHGSLDADFNFTAELNDEGDVVIDTEDFGQVILYEMEPAEIDDEITKIMAAHNTSASEENFIPSAE